MCIKKYFRSLSALLMASLMVGSLYAQTLRSAYHIEGFVFGHELNPAFQPDSSYFSLPVLGNSMFDLRSTLKLSDLLYDTADGKITTFMSRGTIDKSELLDRVGKGWHQSLEGSSTLFSMGFRRSAYRYQTLSLSMVGGENLYLGKEYFNFLKDIENGTYDLSDAGFAASSYLAIAAGESRKLNEHWTVGVKAKLLLGLVNMKMKINDLKAHLGDDKWTAQGHLELSASGVDFKEEEKECSSLEHEGDTYTMVTGLKPSHLGIHGLGLGVDMGVDFRYDEHWSFSASLKDLGFITWLSNKKAINSGIPFEFNGFSDACLEEPDKYDNPDVYKPAQSLGNQMDRLRDDLMNLVHLENQGKQVFTSAIGATAHFAATYKLPRWTFGAIATTRIHGKFSWYEFRMSGAYRVTKGLDVSLNPNYSTFGWGLGALMTYRTSKGHHIFFGSDQLPLKTNNQLIPISLNGSVCFGMSFPIH